MKKLIDDDLTDLLKSIYLAIEQNILMNEEKTSISNEASVLSILIDRSITLTEVKQSSNWQHWQQIIQQEMKEFQMKNIYILIERQSEMKILIEKWMFDHKLNNKKKIIQFRVHWMIREFLQKKEVHYKNIYVAMISDSINRVLFVIATARNWKSRSIDYIFIFLNEILFEDEIIYMKLFIDVMALV